MRVVLDAGGWQKVEEITAEDFRREVVNVAPPILPMLFAGREKATNKAFPIFRFYRDHHRTVSGLPVFVME